MTWLVVVAVGAVAFAVGCGVARHADGLTIDGLREALASTQRGLAEQIAVTAEAVAAQERADAALRARVERLSDAAKGAWQRRKAVRGEVADVT